MTKLFIIAIATLALAAPALAQFDAPTNCEKFRGEWICEDPVGNSEESDGASQDVTTTSRGNLTNKQCSTGPGNSGGDC
jgi:hypothetical protein